MNHPLRAIADALTTCEPLERKRALRDLERVEQRLRRGDYRFSAFGTNVFDIPDRATELITELEFMASIGRAWESLIRESGLNAADAVVEIGSGYLPKVQLGFLYADFRGTLFALDQEEASLRDLERYLSLFRPRYSLTPVVGSLYANSLAPQRGVVANHLFDDLLLDAYCAKHGIPMMQVYGSEVVLRDAWTHIIADETAKADLSPRIALAMARLVAPGGMLIVAQYRSYIERLLNLDRVNDVTVALMDAVCGELGQMGFRARPDVISRALDGTRWVVGARDCRALERAS